MNICTLLYPEGPWWLWKMHKTTHGRFCLSVITWGRNTGHVCWLDCDYEHHINKTEWKGKMGVLFCNWLLYVETCWMVQTGLWLLVLNNRSVDGQSSTLSVIHLPKSQRCPPDIKDMMDKKKDYDYSVITITINYDYKILIIIDPNPAQDSICMNL